MQGMQVSESAVHVTSAVAWIQPPGAQAKTNKSQGGAIAGGVIAGCAAAVGLVAQRRRRKAATTFGEKCVANTPVAAEGFFFTDTSDASAAVVESATGRGRAQTVNPLYGDRL